MQQTFATYSGFRAVAKSDTTLVNCRALYIGGAGNLALSIDGSTTAVTLIAVPIGILPIELNQGRIMSTNSTVADANIIALT